MNESALYKTNRIGLSNRWLIVGVLLSIVLGWLIANMGISIAGLLFVLPFAIAFLILIFFNPRIGLISFIFYCFLMPTIGKHIVGPQFGLLVDALLVLTWLAIFFHQGNKYRMRHLKIDIVWLALIWFGITVLEIGNPTRPNIMGWLQEMRSSSLYWLLVVPLTILIFKKKTDITLFLHIIVILSFIGAVYGMKQLYFGVDAAENRWLEEGAKKTHILFGKLRIFSYYSEAAQFGASQAHLTVMCMALAVGPYSIGRKILYWIAILFIFYGMLISGTRGAMGALVGGGFIFLILMKQVRMLLAGALVGLAFIGMLKFTSIGSGNDQIRRLRSSLDPNDPSLQARLINQRILKDIMASKPIGVGVGAIGQWGRTYNKHIATANIPPDSLYVKMWAMYGIIGFIIWFGMMLYIVGKSAGIIWETRDPRLRNQLISLCAGSFGSLVCSYGNEVMNALPSSAIVYTSLWVNTDILKGLKFKV
jgi:O-antigen ligase